MEDIVADKVYYCTSLEMVEYYVRKRVFKQSRPLF